MHGCGIGGLRHLADLDRVWTLGAFSDLKGHSVSFLKCVERNADELIGMEKEIFVLPLHLYEAEALIGKTGYCSLLHAQLDKLVVSKYQYSGLEKRLEPNSTGSALLDGYILPQKTDAVN